MQASASWSEVGIQVDRVCSENAEISGRTIGNAKALIAFSESHYPVAEDIGPGYWRRSISFSWLEPFSAEVEVYEDHYEFYRFFIGRTEIRHIDVNSDQPLPDALIRLLNGVLLDASLSGTSV